MLSPERDPWSGYSLEWLRLPLLLRTKGSAPGKGGATAISSVWTGQGIQGIGPTESTLQETARRIARAVFSKYLRTLALIIIREDFNQLEYYLYFEFNYILVNNKSSFYFNHLNQINILYFNNKLSYFNFV